MIVRGKLFTRSGSRKMEDVLGNDEPEPVDTKNPQGVTKLFHQFLFGGEVPENLRQCQSSLMRFHMNTEWKWRGWTQESFVSFVEEHYQPFLALFHFGGVTVDLDLEFFQNIEPMLKGAELVLVRAYNADWMNLVGSGGLY